MLLITQEIPNDVLLDIFSFCSPGTLAACARVSYKFLSFASPILYKEITISSKFQLYQLFSRRTSSTKRTSFVTRHLAPFLSISQIRTLHVYSPGSDLGTSPIPRARFQNRQNPHLPLDRLIVHDAETSSPRYFAGHNTIFQHLVPAHLILIFGVKRLNLLGSILPGLNGTAKEVTVVVSLAATDLLWDVIRFFQSGVEIHLRIVIPRIHSLFLSREVRVLRDLHGGGALEAVVSRGGEVIVETESEEARVSVEATGGFLNDEEREVVTVQVKGSEWW